MVKSARGRITFWQSSVYGTVHFLPSVGHYINFGKDSCASYEHILNQEQSSVTGKGPAYFIKCYRRPL
jgi:hypothetical protein